MSDHRPKHESDITTAKPLVAIILGTLALVLIVSVFIWLGFDYVRQRPPASLFKGGATMADEVPRVKPDWPRDLEVLDRQMTERLNTAGWIDREAGVVHMPIDRAMSLLAERGLSDAVRVQGHQRGQP